MSREDLMAPPPRAPGGLARLGTHLDWYWTLSPPGRTAFWATFGGWALDAYNQMTVGFVLPAVTATFALSTTQVGLLGTVGLVMSAVGGTMAGTPGMRNERPTKRKLCRIKRGRSASARERPFSAGQTKSRVTSDHATKLNPTLRPNNVCWRIATSSRVDAHLRDHRRS